MNGHVWLLLCLGLFMPLFLTVELLTIRTLLKYNMTERQFAFREQMFNQAQQRRSSH